MELTPDILAKIEDIYKDNERPGAISMLESAKMHDNSEPPPRCLRCALVASQGSLAKLKYYVDLLAIDYRDVIVAGEYEIKAGELFRVRDLSEPFN